MTDVKRATFIKNMGADSFQGDARLYKCDPPMQYEHWSSDDEQQETDYVIVSAVSVMFSGPETYIFPCDKDGNVTTWGELEGSFRGAYDHSRALRGAGYEVAE